MAGIGASGGSDGGTGGSGSIGLAGGSGGANGVGGIGGVGVIGIGQTTVINDGLIAGGLSATGVRANAVEFYGGDNKLELWSNYAFTGDVIANDAGLGEVDIFALGGTADGTFNVSGFGNQFIGFDRFVKEDSSKWTLTSTTNELTPWEINGGILSVSQEGNLGHINGGLTFDGGTLQITGFAYDTTPRDIMLLSGGGGFDIVESGQTFTLNQVITGDGGLWKNGNGTLVLNGANTYSGDTWVNDGNLVLGRYSYSGAQVQGSTYVYSGAQLTGHGWIGGDLWNEGVVNPGYFDSAFGSLTVNGDYMGNGGTLRIGLDGDSGHGVVSDQLVVSGTAYLSGTTLELNKQYYEMACGDEALVIDAGAYVGQVDLFDISDFNNLMLFDNGTGIVHGVGVLQGENLSHLPGLNLNQQVVAEALSYEVLDGTNFIDADLPFDSIFLAVLDDCDEAGRRLDSLSPEGYAGFTDYGIRVTRNYTRAALGMPGAAPVEPAAPAPMVEPKGAKGGMSAKGGMVMAEEPIAPSSMTTVFAGFTHYDVESDASLNQGNYDIRSNGGFAGVRHTMGSLSFGGFVGYDQGEVSTTFLDADVDGIVLGAFASYLANQDYNILVSGGLTYGMYEFDGTRNSIAGVSSFSGVDNNVWDVFVEVRGDVYTNDRFTLTPSLGLHYINSEVDTILETGGLAPLTVSGMEEDALFAELDLTAKYAVTRDFHVFGSIGYTHNFMDSDRSVSASFGGLPFTVTSPGLAEDMFTFGAGAVWYATDAWTFNAGYRGELGSGQELSSSCGFGASFSF